MVKAGEGDGSLYVPHLSADNVDIRNPLQLLKERIVGNLVYQQKASVVALKRGIESNLVANDPLDFGCTQADSMSQTTQRLQSPLVLQSAWARKFIPGSKLCIQPDADENKRENSPRERTGIWGPLLPGLTDDLAIACLIRVPRIEHKKLHLVCKRWHHLLSEDFFYSLRKSLGMAEEWLYVIKTNRAGRISLHAFDPIYQLWQPLPPVPGDFPEAMWFGCAVLSDCHLYIFGGVDMEGSKSIRHVIFYSARTNKWHRAPDMLQKRNLFRSCVINNCVYVSGGELEGNQMTRSAEVYDPSQKRWSFISEMSTAMVPLFSVVHNGTWFLKGNEIGSGNSMCEAYSPETDTWTLITNGMGNGWGNDCISLNGQLYALDCQDGCKFTVYDRATDSWKKFIDSKLHVGKFPALVAAAPVSLNGKLCIIRYNMSISLVDVSSPSKQVESHSHDLWENVARKGHCRSLVRKLWSTIAGRGCSDSCIVCCKVLEA
ncbi:hypothetical protein VNO78_04412 [Psophocarpus tetragonolobus]|uniref:FKB95-like N-terminal Kelch domain-containing protein n=1 Tax=Psophocarpus tetragonolobus TaxID=3891 RepID=A0AAN9XXG7_PSOTE